MEWRERVVNHLPKELDATYNLYEYDEEKETSMKRWEEELLRILKHKKILKLRLDYLRWQLDTATCNVGIFKQS